MPTQQQQRKNIVIDPERLLPVEAVLGALLQSKRASYCYDKFPYLYIIY